MNNCAEITKLQRFIAKKIQGFHQHVRSDMCESMLSLYNLIGEVSRRKLLFLGKLCTLGKKKKKKKICVFPVSRPTLIFRATPNILSHF